MSTAEHTRMHPSTNAPIARILIVDDHLANRVALVATLGPLACEIVQAGSGEDALKQLLQDDFAVILLDVIMPGFDGFQTADLVRQREQSRNTPIVFISAGGYSPEELRMAYEHGAVDYVTKPFDPAILRAKVSVFIELYRQREQIRRQAAVIARHEMAASLLASEQQARIDAESAARTRDDLLATVSHDLRNPLGVVMTTAAIIRQTARAGELSDRTLAQLTRIERSARRMEVLIADLLDIAAIESGHLSVDLRSHPVHAVLADAVDALHPLAHEKQIDLRVHAHADDEAVVCDRYRIGQVFSNIVGNALKFTEPGGSVTLRSQSGRTHVEFAITDTGPGIPDDQLPLVFDRFWQAKETARAGTGLGLAICRGIVEGHGGTIRVESQMGAGTTFYFTVPRDRAGAAV